MKCESVNLIILIKEERCGNVQDRACADSRKQHKYISKEKMATPMIQLSSFLLTLLINAQEKRDSGVKCSYFSKNSGRVSRVKKRHFECG